MFQNRQKSGKIEQIWQILRSKKWILILKAPEMGWHEISKKVTVRPLSTPKMMKKNEKLQKKVKKKKVIFKKTQKKNKKRVGKLIKRVI